MALDQMSADEFVDHAVYLCGDRWRNELPEMLGMSRKSLVLSLASGEDIPAELTLSLIKLIEQRLDEMAREQQRLRDRVDALRGNYGRKVISVAQPNDYFKHAC